MTEIKYCSLFMLIILTFFSCVDDESSEEVQLNNQNQIESFIVVIDSAEYESEINLENNTINLTLPPGTDLTQISPIIATSERASVSPVSGVAQNFQSPETYTVTAENGATREYLVTIIAPSDKNKILSLSITMSDLDNINGFIDEESKSILLEVPNFADISTLEISLSVSENATSIPSTGSIIDLNSPYIYEVIAENGDIAEYRVTTYSINQLENPNGDNSGAGWNFEGNTGVESSSELGNVFFVVANDGDFSPNVNQTITFPRDYSGKYILFIGNLTTERIMEGSITRHPYLWAYQIGSFSEDDWIFMQGMSHTESENVWQIVYGIHELLPNVDGTYFQMAQALQNGDPYDGTKSKYRGLEVRLFESAVDAEIYIEKLY